MGILGIILLVVFVMVSILLVIMVVIQDSDSDSLGGLFAGGSGSAFGSRSTNVVVRFTYILGALFFVTAFSLALINKTSIGNVADAAAAKQSGGTATSDWWNAQPQSKAPAALQGQGTTSPTNGSQVGAPPPPPPQPTTTK
ncbi:MAG TPA: preprotein translocase subunit SecG [Rectinemataceae bacterium]|nr:preprotein translocase subunit SecG [Rectinemataceae bacterium]